MIKALPSIHMNEADQRTQRIENMIDFMFQLVFTLELMAFEFMLHHSIRAEKSKGIQKPKKQPPARGLAL